MFLEESNKSLTEHRIDVTTPQGATAEGLNTLEKYNIRYAC